MREPHGEGVPESGGEGKKLRVVCGFSGENVTARNSPWALAERAVAAKAAAEKSEVLSRRRGRMAELLSQGSGKTGSSAPPLVDDVAGALEARAKEVEEKSVGDWLWPVEWHGMPLGKFIQKIRQGDVDARFHPRRRPVLDRLGFKWTGTERYLNFTWDKLMDGVSW